MQKKSSKGAHPSCKYSLKYQLVLVTFERREILNEAIFKELKSKAHQVSDQWGVKIENFEGGKCYVLMTLEMPPSIEPSKFINNLKTVTSRYLRKKHEIEGGGDNFLTKTWSRGYHLTTRDGDTRISMETYLNSGKF